MINLLVLQVFTDWLKKLMQNSDIVIKVFTLIDIGILNLGAKTLLLELTGKQANHLIIDKHN